MRLTIRAGPITLDRFQKRIETSAPDTRELIALTKLAAEHGFGRPHEAPKKPQAHPGGFSTTALEAMTDEELVALLGEDTPESAPPIRSGSHGVSVVPD